MAIFYTPAAEKKFKYLVNLTKPWKKYIKKSEWDGWWISVHLVEQDEKFRELSEYMRKRNRHLRILKRILKKSTSVIDLDELDEKILLRLYENVMKGCFAPKEEVDDGEC